MNLFGYLRFSPRPVVHWTIEKQRNDILRWAAAHGHVIVGWYQDSFVSGDDNAGKVAQAALLEALRQGGAEGLVFADLSRWTRDDAIPALFFIDQLEKEGVILFSTNDEFLNAPSPVRALALLLILSQNEAALKKIREDSSKGAIEAIKHGIWFGRVPRYWRRIRSLADERDRAPVEGQSYWIECVDEAAVKALFEGRRVGKSLGTLAADFGITKQQVGRVLSFKENNKVVGPDLWNAVQGMKSFQRHSMVYRSFLLTGLILCSTCGRRMSGSMRYNLKADDRVAYHCRYDGVPHAWRNVEQQGLLGLLLRSFDGLDLDDATRLAVSTRLNHPIAAARLTERERLLAENDIQRNVMLGHRKRRDLPEDMIESNLLALERAKGRIPSETAIDTPPRRAPIDVLCSLGATLRQLKDHEDYPAVQVANAILRDVIESITFDEGDRNRPRIHLKVEMGLLYDDIRAVVPAAQPMVGVANVREQSERQLAKAAKTRAWSQTPNGIASHKAAAARYRAKTSAKRQAAQRDASDKRHQPQASPGTQPRRSKRRSSADLVSPAPPEPQSKGGNSPI